MLSFEYRWYILVYSKKRIDGHLRGPDGIFNGKHHIIRNFAELPDKCEILRPKWHYFWPVPFNPRHELARDKRHHARNADCSINNWLRLVAQFEVLE